jgi:hypothetical protein
MSLKIIGFEKKLKVWERPLDKFEWIKLKSVNFFRIKTNSYQIRLLKGEHIGRILKRDQTRVRFLNRPVGSDSKI